MRAGSAGVPTTPRGALLDSAFVGRLQDCRFERQCPHVPDTVGTALGRSTKSMSALGSTFTVMTKGLVWGFKRASWPVSEVCASDGVPATLDSRETLPPERREDSSSWGMGVFTACRSGALPLGTPKWPSWTKADGRTFAFGLLGNRVPGPPVLKR